MTGSDLIPPISAAGLRRLRLQLRKSVPTLGLGPHLRRRQGQSLEFREFRAYQPGDDIRAVDWTASARRPPRDGLPDLMVRSFEAEEQLTLAIVVDARAAMRLPERSPKLLYALWAMQALTAVASEAGDRVLLAAAFDPSAAAPLRASGREAPARARSLAERLWAQRPDPAVLPNAGVGRLVRMLKPASAVVLISDMLFDDPGGEMDQMAWEAQKARRELLVMELDSFEAEADLVPRDMPLRLAEAEARTFGAEPVNLGEALIRETEERVRRFLDERRRRWARGGLVWKRAVRWPAGNRGGPDLAALFAEDFPRHPVLRGVLATDLG